MVKVLRKDILTVGGLQNQFVGVQVDEFLLRPDSDSGTRPSALQVEGQKITLLVEGGEAPLRVGLHSKGIRYSRFQSQLSNEEKTLLTELASDLAGRLWPDAGETLRQRIETLGEEKILRALLNLFKGVESTMKGIALCNRVPFVGQRLEEFFFPTVAS